MIRYALKCENGHGFDSWFSGSDSFDDMRARNLVTCVECGSSNVSKSLMTPGVPVRQNTKAEAPAAHSGARPGDKAPEKPSLQKTPQEAALAQLRKKIESESEYVGKDFATEARRIHLGESEARGIWGEASGADAKDLIDEGIPVAPIPFMRRLDG